MSQTARHALPVISTTRPGLFDKPPPRHRRAEAAAAPPPTAMARELRSSSLALSILAASVKWPCASSSLTCSKLGPIPSWYEGGAWLWADCGRRGGSDPRECRGPPALRRGDAADADEGRLGGGKAHE